MEMISRRMLILSYTIQQVIPNICTKFQTPRFSSTWEIFDEKKSLPTHPQTLLLKRQTIYLLYTLYTGGIINQQRKHEKHMTENKNAFTKALTLKHLKNPKVTPILPTHPSTLPGLFI